MALRGAFQVATLILVSLSSLQLSLCKRETLCPPQQEQNNVTAQTGTHVKLDCQSSGAAIISVKWFIDDENDKSLLIEKSMSAATLTPNPRVRFESGVGPNTTSIFLGPLEKQDEHNYSCFLNIKSCPLSVTTITLTVIEQTTNDHVGIGLALGFFLLLTVLLFLYKTCKHRPSHCWKPCDGKEDQHQPSVVYSEVWVKNATPEVEVNSRVDRTVYAILEK